MVNIVKHVLELKGLANMYITYDIDHAKLYVRQLNIEQNREQY